MLLWDVSTANIIRKFRGHDAAINAVRVCCRPEMLAPQTRLGACFLNTPAVPGIPTPLQIKYGPSNEVLVTGGYDQAVKVWDCRSRSIDPIQVMKSFRDSVTSLAITQR